jgi:hypothetical protein
MNRHINVCEELLTGSAVRTSSSSRHINDSCVITILDIENAIRNLCNSTNCSQPGGDSATASALRTVVLHMTPTECSNKARYSICTALWCITTAEWTDEDRERLSQYGVYPEARSVAGGAIRVLMKLSNLSTGAKGWRCAMKTTRDALEELVMAVDADADLVTTLMHLHEDDLACYGV